MSHLAHACCKTFKDFAFSKLRACSKKKKLGLSWNVSKRLVIVCFVKIDLWTRSNIPQINVGGRKHFLQCWVSNNWFISSIGFHVPRYLIIMGNICQGKACLSSRFNKSAFHIVKKEMDAVCQQNSSMARAYINVFNTAKKYFSDWSFPEDEHST